jgi:hypothetical protein
LAVCNTPNVFRGLTDWYSQKHGNNLPFSTKIFGIYCGVRFIYLGVRFIYLAEYLQHGDCRIDDALMTRRPD